jgi:hypothetical protein
MSYVTLTHVLTLRVISKLLHYNILKLTIRSLIAILVLNRGAVLVDLLREHDQLRLAE